jgi:hypothetical protein
VTWLWSWHPPPFNADLKNEWNYTSTPPFACMPCIGITLLLPLLYVVWRYYLWYKLSNVVPKYNQQDATLYNSFISTKCCTCFRRIHRPSSGAQNCTYSTGFVCTCKPVAALPW